jgi:hypothetical protein
MLSPDVNEACELLDYIYSALAAQPLKPIQLLYILCDVYAQVRDTIAPALQLSNEQFDIAFPQLAQHINLSSHERNITTTRQ